jgi:hypothetical protein
MLRLKLRNTWLLPKDLWMPVTVNTQQMYKETDTIYSISNNEILNREILGFIVKGFELSRAINKNVRTCGPDIFLFKISLFEMSQKPFLYLTVRGMLTSVSFELAVTM